MNAKAKGSGVRSPFSARTAACPHVPRRGECMAVNKKEVVPNGTSWLGRLWTNQEVIRAEAPKGLNRVRPAGLAEDLWLQTASVLAGP